jgi:hypothetical protein
MSYHLITPKIMVREFGRVLRGKLVEGGLEVVAALPDERPVTQSWVDFGDGQNFDASALNLPIDLFSQQIIEPSASFLAATILECPDRSGTLVTMPLMPPTGFEWCEHFEWDGLHLRLLARITSASFDARVDVAYAFSADAERAKAVVPSPAQTPASSMG